MNPGLHGAIAAAQAAKKRKQEQEEENMAQYGQEELSGEWEFKIVRSEFPLFRNRQRLAQIVNEEALSGWELLEKLDDSRLRFKRHTSQRRRDEMLPRGVDPYRTQVGGFSSKALLTGMVVALLMLGMVGFLFFESQGGISLGGSAPWVLLALIGGVLLALGFAALAFLRK